MRVLASRNWTLKLNNSLFISVEITAALKLLWPVYYKVLNLDQYSCYDSVHGCTGCHSSEHSMEWRKLLYERWRSYFDLLRDLELQIRITFHLKHKSECKWYLWSCWKCVLIDDCKYNIIVLRQNNAVWLFKYCAKI